VARLRYGLVFGQNPIPVVIIALLLRLYLSALELRAQLIVTLRLISDPLSFMPWCSACYAWLTFSGHNKCGKNVKPPRLLKAFAGSENLYACWGAQIDIPKINPNHKAAHVFIGFTWWSVSGWWKIMLPAFSLLDRIELWQSSSFNVIIRNSYSTGNIDPISFCWICMFLLRCLVCEIFPVQWIIGYQAFVD